MPANDAPDLADSEKVAHIAADGKHDSPERHNRNSRQSFEDDARAGGETVVYGTSDVAATRMNHKNCDGS